MKKLYRVEASVVAYFVAEVGLGERRLRECAEEAIGEGRHQGDPLEILSITEPTRPQDVKSDGWDDAIPYGQWNDDSPDRTCGEWVQPQPARTEAR